MAKNCSVCGKKLAFLENLGNDAKPLCTECAQGKEKSPQGEKQEAIQKSPLRKIILFISFGVLLAAMIHSYTYNDWRFSHFVRFLWNNGMSVNSARQIECYWPFVLFVILLITGLCIPSSQLSLKQQVKKVTENEYFCSSCGAIVSIDDKVCSKCGADVSEIEEENQQRPGQWAV